MSEERGEYKAGDKCRQACERIVELARIAAGVRKLTPTEVQIYAYALDALEPDPAPVTPAQEAVARLRELEESDD